VKTSTPHALGDDDKSLCGQEGRTVTKVRWNGCSLCPECWTIMAGPESQPRLRAQVAKHRLRDQSAE